MIVPEIGRVKKVPNEPCAMIRDWRIDASARGPRTIASTALGPTVRALGAFPHKREGQRRGIIGEPNELIRDTAVVQKKYS
jgi:hypothetical protein